MVALTALMIYTHTWALLNVDTHVTFNSTRTGTHHWGPCKEATIHLVAGETLVRVSKNLQLNVSGGTVNLQPHCEQEQWTLRLPGKASSKPKVIISFRLILSLGPLQVVVVQPIELFKITAGSRNLQSLVIFARARWCWKYGHGTSKCNSELSFCPLCGYPDHSRSHYSSDVHCIICGDAHSAFLPIMYAL